MGLNCRLPTDGLKCWIWEDWALNLFCLLGALTWSPLWCFPDLVDTELWLWSVTLDTTARVPWLVGSESLTWFPPSDWYKLLLLYCLTGGGCGCWSSLWPIPWCHRRLLTFLVHWYVAFPPSCSSILLSRYHFGCSPSLSLCTIFYCWPVWRVGSSFTVSHNSFALSKALESSETVLHGKCNLFLEWFWTSGQMSFGRFVDLPIQILLCFLGDAHNLLVQGPDASDVEGSCSTMLLAVLLKLLLTASISTVLAICSRVLVSWIICFTLCLADSEPRSLSLPGNLGKAFSPGVSVEICSSWSRYLGKVDCHFYVLQHNVLCAPNDKDVVYTLGTFA